MLAIPENDRPWLLDVRTPQEFAAGSLPGALNIPVDDLRSRIAEIPNGRPIAVYCQVGQRGYIATRILRQHGIEAANIGGGYKTYRLFPSRSLMNDFFAKTPSRKGANKAE